MYSHTFIGIVVKAPKKYKHHIGSFTLCLRGQLKIYDAKMLECGTSEAGVK